MEVTLSDLVWHSQQPLALAVFHKNSTDSQVKEVVQFLGTAHSAYPGVSGFRIRYQGCEQLVRGRSEKEFQLEKFMLPAEEGKDSSKYLLSPMPGLLYHPADRTVSLNPSLGTRYAALAVGRGGAES